MNLLLPIHGRQASALPERMKICFINKSDPENETNLAISILWQMYMRFTKDATVRVISPACKPDNLSFPSKPVLKLNDPVVIQ
jgi:hypothetical protein